MALEPTRLEPQVVYVERRTFGCFPSCGCCLLAALLVLFGCVLAAWFVLVALGLR